MIKIHLRYTSRYICICHFRYHRTSFTAPSARNRTRKKVNRAHARALQIHHITRMQRPSASHTKRFHTLTGIPRAQGMQGRKKYMVQIVLRHSAAFSDSQQEFVRSSISEIRLSASLSPRSSTVLVVATRPAFTPSRQATDLGDSSRRPRAGWERRPRRRSRAPRRPIARPLARRGASPACRARSRPHR